MARCLAYVPVGWSATNIRPAASSQSDLRVGGVVAYAAGGVWAGLCLYPLLPGVAAGHLGPGSATGAADPLGGGVGAACPCPGAHVGLPGSSRSGSGLVRRHQSRS